jgi:hypothetical protein
VKVNWIKSIAYGIGFTGLSSIPQISLAQTGQYVPPSGWNNFNVTRPAPSHPAPSEPAPTAQQDPASPHFRTVSSTTPRPEEQQQAHWGNTPSYSYAPTQSRYGITQPPAAAVQQPVQPRYSAPPSIMAGQTAAQAPSHTIARRNDASAYANPGIGESIERLPAGPISEGAPLASEQFHNYSPVPAQSPFMAAASAPWEAGHCASGTCGSGLAGDFEGMGCGPVRPPLFPWFGGGDILFWSMANNTNKRLVVENGMPSTTLLSTRDVDPGNGIGYDLFFGRYFGCGRYAISVNYLNFDPGREREMITGVPANLLVTMPAFATIGYYDDHTDPASPYNSVYASLDAMPNFAVERNVAFQGIEVNLWSFGFGGARRLAPAYGTGLSCGLQSPFASHAGHCGHGGACGTACGPACPPAHGYGGFGGPLERPCVGSCQLALSQGFRWFQFNDDFRFSGDNGVARVMFDSNARNDLFGYQIGGRWNYCVSPRINLGVGGRFGLYANHLEVHQRVGNNVELARYQSDNPASRRPVSSRDRGTAFASLGEFDLGGGLRLTDCWTFRAGYRVLGATGVATSVGMIRHEMFSESLNARHVANDSVLLHGAYVGSEFNW